MDFAATARDLAKITDRETTTTKSAATQLAADTRAALQPLRDFLDELVSRIDEAEATIEQLDEADQDDREDAYEALVDAVGQVRDWLIPDQRPTS